MAYNTALTVDDLINRYTILQKHEEKALDETEKTKEAYDIPCTAGFQSEDLSYAYYNVCFMSELEQFIPKFEYENDQGEMVVDYDDMREHLTSFSANGDIVNIPETYLGEKVILEVKKEEGWYNIKKIRTTKNRTLGDTNFDPRSNEENMEFSGQSAQEQVRQ